MGIDSHYDDIANLQFKYSENCEEVIPTLSQSEFGHVLKLYPFEWIAQEVKSDSILAHDLEQADILEPAWKLIIGNKALLPLLWEMYPNHPNLLPAYFIDPREAMKG